MGSTAASMGAWGTVAQYAGLAAGVAGGLASVVGIGLLLAPMSA
ncbi:hypothetical protein [Speluncibacter jeojiensis]|uniref:Uncharacterized protein n=1 Tax=Speluncibacter jeojiensis TaxID=2710754 RepID=A0A9X4M5C7_9ACTN|nr:hypothetical protein [Corynebacteriales bacterium D3-21]